MPANLPLEQAGGVPLVALTAWQVGRFCGACGAGLLSSDGCTAEFVHLVGCAVLGDCGRTTTVDGMPGGQQRSAWVYVHVSMPHC